MKEVSITKNGRCDDRAKGVCMGALNVGDTVRMKQGGDATVLEELGSGGQGTVYRVRYQGKDFCETIH